jgi:hypothetical protein
VRRAHVLSAGVLCNNETRLGQTQCMFTCDWYTHVSLRVQQRKTVRTDAMQAHVQLVYAVS